MRQLTLVLCCAFLIAPAVAAADPSPSPSPAASSAAATAIAIAQGRIDTMLRSGHADPAWFTESFLAQVPASKVDDIVAQLTSALGKYKSVEFTPSAFIAHFEKGTDDILIHMNDQNKIDGLLFKPPSMTSSP